MEHVSALLVKSNLNKPTLLGMDSFCSWNLLQPIYALIFNDNTIT